MSMSKLVAALLLSSAFIVTKAYESDTYDRNTCNCEAILYSENNLNGPCTWVWPADEGPTDEGPADEFTGAPHVSCPKNQDFTHPSFSQIFIHNEFNLRGAYLEGVILRNLPLGGINLSGANLKGADLWNANLANAKLIGANLEDANLKYATLNYADLSGADLTNADLDTPATASFPTSLIGATLTQAELNDADLDNAIMKNAKLNGAKLRKASFRYANLEGADLRGADLGVSLQNDPTRSETTPVMSNANLKNAKFDFGENAVLNFGEQGIPPFLYVTGATLTGTILENKFDQCSVSTACNYNKSPVTKDDSQCVYLPSGPDGNCKQCSVETDGTGKVDLVDGGDNNNNGVCDDKEVTGCMETDACNYNNKATLPPSVTDAPCLTGTQCAQVIAQATCKTLKISFLQKHADGDCEC